jgi:hypothetical protein
MKWLQYSLQRYRDRRENRRLERQAKEAATAVFAQAFPHDKTGRVNVAEKTQDYFVIGITYDAGVIPPPYRFFQVALPSFQVTKLPRDYWPPAWGVYR